MKYIFFGTHEFSAIILEKLIGTGIPPVAIVCNPDKPTGRKKIITPPQTKVSAEKYKIPIFQPETLVNSKLQFTNYKPDFFLVAAYAKIIPKEILEISRLGTIGVHPSLLPKFRGPSPIQSAILAGEKDTGVTLFLVDGKIDHGLILATRELKFSIFNFQFSKLHNELASLGADLLIETLPKFIKGEIKPIAQNENEATFTRKFIAEDGYIEPQDLEKALGLKGSPQEIRRLAIEIDRKIRALNPEPGVWTLLSPAKITSLIRANSSISNSVKKNLKRMKILEAELTPEGNLKLKKIQFEGKKPVEI